MDDTLIKVEDLCKIYNPGENEVRALEPCQPRDKEGGTGGNYRTVRIR